MKLNFVSRIIESIVDELNATLVLEPKYKFGGYIEFDNGVRTFFVESAFDINPMGASRMAKDKGYTNHFLNSFGFSIPEYDTFANSVLDKYLNLPMSGFQLGRAFCENIGFPLIIKPNDGTKGSDVYKINNHEEYDSVGQTVFEKNRVVMIQKFVAGNDYRIVVFKNEVICAYERKGLEILGDGRSTVMELLEKKKRVEKLNLDDPRIKFKMNSHRISFETVLEEQRKIKLLDVNNLSLGGSAIDKTPLISDYFKEIAIEASQKMGLNFCGVDIMTDSLEDSDCQYNIIEMNSSPGQGNFARLGLKQEKIIKNLYKDILITIKEQKDACQ